MGEMRMLERVVEFWNASRTAGANANRPMASALLDPFRFDLEAHGSLIGWLVVGLLAGWLSGEVVRGKGFGCLGNTLLGLIGAVVGGWMFERMHIATFGFIGELAAATVGAVAIVALARAIAGSD